jgi:hypothetical protein
MTNKSLLEIVVILSLFGCGCAGCVSNRLVSVDDPEPSDGSIVSVVGGDAGEEEAYEDGGSYLQDAGGYERDAGKTRGADSGYSGVNSSGGGSYRCLVNGVCVFCLPGDSAAQYCVNGDAGL